MVENLNLEHEFSNWKEVFAKTRTSFHPSLLPKETGMVKSVESGIARVQGLPHAENEELLKFPDDLNGIAFNLDEDEIGVIILGDDASLHVGDEVKRTGRVMDVPVGQGLVGRIINPLGEPLDDYGTISYNERWPIERQAAAIMDRLPVRVPLQTGIKAIDALIPVGRGQRELIMGDRQTGKTTIAVDTIINQKGKNVLCVYCSIGQRASAVAKVIAQLRESEAMQHTIAVITEGNDAPGLQYIAPYAATSIAEYFMEKGEDVLIVYDDLSKHAIAYRELSLLLRRPPGREAFPGDIFYIHARLLERSTHLDEAHKGGSLTALPIIETEAQDISAYIPTNLISITDGQIYLSPQLFELGVLPAIDIGKSVSRVGGKTQLPIYGSVAGDLKLTYAQFEELESFSRFGARLDEDSRLILEHGRRIRSCLKQSPGDPFPVTEQILVLLSLQGGLLETIPIEKMKEVEKQVRALSKELPSELQNRIKKGSALGDAEKKTILELIKNRLASTGFQIRQE